MLCFNNAVDIASYDDAYMALTKLTNYETLNPSFILSNRSKRSALENLIIAMIDHEQSGRLSSFPFPGLQDLVDEILFQRSEEVVDIRPSSSYHKVLFAWRIRHGDFQGGKYLSFLKYAYVSCFGDVSTSSIIEKCFKYGNGC